LIGHLLAQGKSVLVTSHTTKALRMVRHHIVPGLRPLCVRRFGKRSGKPPATESAVAAIAERLGNVEASSLEHEHVSWKSSATICLRNSMLVLQQLAKARAGEYREIIVGDKALVPAEAARKVTQEQPVHGWIPGPLWPKYLSLSLTMNWQNSIAPMCQFHRKTSANWSGASAWARTASQPEQFEANGPQ